VVDFQSFSYAVKGVLVGWENRIDGKWDTMNLFMMNPLRSLISARVMSEQYQDNVERCLVKAHVSQTRAPSLICFREPVSVVPCEHGETIAVLAEAHLHHSHAICPGAEKSLENVSSLNRSKGSPTLPIADRPTPLNANSMMKSLVHSPAAPLGPSHPERKGPCATTLSTER